jgi:hypothetical protein
MFKRILFVITVLAFMAFMFTPRNKPPEIVNMSPLFLVEPTQSATPIRYVTHDRVWLPENMLCPQWAQLAIDVGWREKDLAKLDAILHRESRCFVDSHYALDPFGGSYGLMQINAFWCKPSKYYPTGYLQSFGVLSNCKQLFHPRTNLIAARLIWQYSYTQYGDGWLPWQP